MNCVGHWACATRCWDPRCGATRRSAAASFASLQHGATAATPSCAVVRLRRASPAPTNNHRVFMGKRTTVQKRAQALAAHLRAWSAKRRSSSAPTRRVPPDQLAHKTLCAIGCPHPSSGTAHAGDRRCLAGGRQARRKSSRRWHPVQVAVQQELQLCQWSVQGLMGTMGMDDRRSSVQTLGPMRTRARPA